MSSLQELAGFKPMPPERQKVGLDQKVQESIELLFPYIHPSILEDHENDTDFTMDGMRRGVIPRLSPYELRHIPEGARLVRIPDKLVERFQTERSYDLIIWNTPDKFLFRLKLGKQEFAPPVPGKSRVMDDLHSKGKVVSFEDLKIEAPEPVNGRKSRKRIDQGIESNIMGQGRIPFALGSVPDVGSELAYITTAMANGMVFVSRDKLLSDPDQQAAVIRNVIDYLSNVKLPEELKPSDEQLSEFTEIVGFTDPLTDDNKDEVREKYLQALRSSWIANVGAAIEADAQSEKGSKALDRAKKLYEAGCRMFRIYSPEGGMEIVDTAKALRKMLVEDSSVKIVGGQIMDAKTALKAEHVGCDALFIGVAGGSQCTTSVSANIPVNTPNLLYELRRGEISIPVGIEGGGVGTDFNTAFVLGASFVSKPGELGRSWEGLGGKYVFETPDGEYFMVYGGEASVSAKWFKDSLDKLERPLYVEGETGIRMLDPDMLQGNMSMTRTISRLRHDLSNGLVFQRADSIAELHTRTADNVVLTTTSAAEKSKPYAK